MDDLDEHCLGKLGRQMIQEGANGRQKSLAVRD
jgi:hypothetical protein